jgi:hypothetical protein
MNSSYLRCLVSTPFEYRNILGFYYLCTTYIWLSKENVSNSRFRKQLLQAQDHVLAN